MAEASHAEYDADAALPLITLASCPVDNRREGAPNLWGKLEIRVSTGSLAYGIYQRQKIQEEFTCNYELNPAFQADIEAGGLGISGVGERGEARVVELAGHRFFLATLFLPQLTSTRRRPHPLIAAYLDAVLRSKAASQMARAWKSGEKA
jgi:CTP synthase (UTP-ammonia lyase)